MEGFDAGNRELPDLPPEVTEQQQDRLAEVLAAMTVACGATPEEVLAFLDGDNPDLREKVDDLLKDPANRQEFRDHARLVLAQIVEPAATT